MAPQANYSKLALVVLSMFSVIFLGFYFYLDSLEKGYKTYATLPDGTRIEIGIAKTDAERAKGLSGRASMRANEGLYFVFPEEDRYGFWMKDMLFPIDIIWIRQGKIVDIDVNVPHEPGVSDGELKIYRPSEPVSSVLEMNSGSAVRYELKTGDSIKVQIVSEKR